MGELTYKPRHKPGPNLGRLGVNMVGYTANATAKLRKGITTSTKAVPVVIQTPAGPVCIGYGPKP